MDGVILTPLMQINHPKGDIYHALKKSADTFLGFGEAYFTSITFNDIKGWKKHSHMALNLIVPVGCVEFVIHDDRVHSTTKGEFFAVQLSQDNYQRLTILPGLWVAFKGCSKDLNLVLNIASIEHDPKESINVDLMAIAYEW
jgi:dTDP-4-dehydrorhamnose 3,5-epimerase